MKNFRDITDSLFLEICFHKYMDISARVQALMTKTDKFARAEEFWDVILRTLAEMSGFFTLHNG